MKNARGGRRPGLWLWAVSTALLWPGPACVPAWADEIAAAPLRYFYFKEPRALRLDEGRVGVLRARAGAEGAGRGLPAMVIPERDVEMWPVAGWSLVRSPGGEAAARGAGLEPLAALRARMTPFLAEPWLDFVSPVFIDDLGGPLLITPDILVGFNPGVPGARAEAILGAVGPPGAGGAGVITDRDWDGMAGVYRVRSRSRNGLDVLETANALAQMPDVRFAEPDVIFTGRGGLIPNDPGFANCWGIDNTGQFGGTPDQDMDGAEAWDVTIGSPSILVVVIDVGVQQDHPDINQVGGVDTTSDAPMGFSGGPVNSFDNHATAVAGCVSAKINNSLGTVGIAPGCRSASARTFIGINSSGNWTSTASWTVDSLAWGQTIGARVTNNSNNYGFSSSAIAQKYSDTRDAGQVHFAASGNDSTTNLGYPASLSSVNAVAALTPTGALASFSTTGPGLDFSAPGTLVYSTDRTGGDGYFGGDYGFVQGTSFASPYTAGVAALVLSKNSLQTAAQVEAILRATAVDKGTPGYDETFGWGFVNARGALDATPAAGPPGAFSLLSPSGGATNVVRLPSFSWSTSVNAPTYSLKVDDDPAFGSPEINATTSLTAYTHAGTPLAAATTYYWRVRATNALGMTDSAPLTSSFTTISVPPGGFALASPADGATGLSLTPTLTWGAAPLAEAYAVKIDDNADFSSPVVNTTVAGPIYGVTAPLAGSTLYYWTVRALNPIGGTDSTPFSRQFTTVGTPPSSFNLLSPPDGPNIATRTPTLTWGASVGASSYTVEVDDDLNFGNREVNQTGVAGTSYMVASGVLANMTRYYWRVTAMNPSGSTPGTPAAQSFGVLVPPCTGDANADGLVNFADVSSVFANWATTYPPGNTTGPGDANHDRSVNFVDVTTVFSNYLVPCP